MAAPLHPCNRGTSASCTSHWTNNYIGTPYRECDCAELAQRVQREVFWREIALPSERDGGVFALSAQIQRLRDDYGSRTEQPVDGDAVLMLGAGRLWHIGVYVETCDIAYVLHAIRSAGQACLHKLRDLQRMGFTVEGFYKWKL